MKKLTLFAVAAAAIVLVSTPASASIVFDLVGVTLQGGGALTGSFTTNDTLTSVTNVDITASAGTFGPGVYPALTYDALPYFTLLPLVFDVNGPAGVSEELQIAFASSLTTSGANIATASFDDRTSIGSRAVLTGSVVAAPSAGGVPEPATWALMISGIGLTGAMLRQRRSTAIAAAA